MDSSIIAPNEVEIAALLPLTGKLSPFGTQLNYATELAAEDFNAYLEERGVTWRLGIVSEDTETNAVRALEKVQALHARGIDIIVGPAGSAQLSSILAYMNNNNMVAISPSSTAPALAIPDDAAFRTVPDDFNQGRAIGALLEHEGIEAVVPIWRGEVYGDGLVNASAVDFESRGGIVYEGVRYNPEPSEYSVSVADLADTVSEMLEAHDADQIAVLIVAFDEAVSIFQVAATYDVLDDVRWFGGEAVAQSTDIASDRIASQFAIDTELYTVQLLLDPGDRADSVSERIREWLGSEPTAFVYTAYDAVWLAGLSVLESGSADPANLRGVIHQVAASYSGGALSSTDLNEAGDLILANYETWLLREGGWVRGASYDSQSDSIVDNSSEPYGMSDDVVALGEFDALGGPRGVDIAEIVGRMYAVVAALDDDGVQVIDITDPRDPTPVSSVFDGEGGFDALPGADGVAVTEIADRMYVVVTGWDTGSVQVIDITEPWDPAPVSSVFDGEGGFDALARASGVAVAEIADRTYAVVVGWDDDGVQVIDITDPRDPAPVSSVFGWESGFDALFGASGVAVAEIADRMYVVVTGEIANGVQIIDITEPWDPAPVSSVFDGEGGFDALEGAWDVSITRMSDRTYAVVTGYGDDGVQIIDITDPRDPAPVSSVFDGEGGFDALFGIGGIDVTEIADRTYAVVVGEFANGVQIIDITDPRDPAPISSVFDGEGGFDALEGAWDVSITRMSDRTYAVVTGELANGVQIIDITEPWDPLPVSGTFDVAAGSDVVVLYKNTDDPIHYGLRAWLIDNEDTVVGADSVTDYLMLPSDLHVTFETCGLANAWYNSVTHDITMCYELADEYTALFRESDIGTGYGVANALHWVFMHEVGHAVIDIYGLPIAGQEEDAADQFATIMLLREGMDGARALQAMAHVYDSSDGYTPSWDTHSLDSQRYYNMICLLYGKHHDDNIGQSVEYRIPDSRAIRCPGEYSDAVFSWAVLLADHIRPP